MNNHNKELSPRIHILPTELANQIAAGEVVERPASVLKELVENSLDAEATSISAIIEDGGQACIKVQDNGRGIPKDELKLALTRHATSKVQNISDLSTINSFGFRGEALPSIASVSRFRIASKSIDDEQAFQVSVLFGDMQEIMPSTLQRGTEIEVRDLFNNIPARLKFLKNPNTEQKRAQDLFTRIALIHQNKAFSLHTNVREILSFLENDSLFDRISKIWSPSITSHLLEVDENIYDINIQGLISNPRSLYSKSDKLLLYVNNRPVNDKVLIRAVRQAYRHSLTTKDYPQVILNLHINPEEVDVNVHPAKSEVRFRDEQNIFKAMHVAVEKALSKKLFLQENFSHAQNFPHAQTFSHTEENTVNNSNFSAPTQINNNLDYPSYDQQNINQNSIHSLQFQEAQNQSLETLTSAHYAKSNHFNEQIDSSLHFHDQSSNEGIKNSHHSGLSQEIGFWGRADEMAFKTEPIKGKSQFTQNSIDSSLDEKKNIDNIMEMPEYLCQIAHSYLLFKLQSNDVFVLDQHAVHERILYEKLSKKEQIERQKLLLPLTIALHKSEVDSFENLNYDFTRLGFKCEYNEESQQLECHEIPYIFQYSGAEKFIKDALKHEKTKIDQLFMDSACDLAIKANQRLSHEEVKKLYMQWVQCDMPDFCPHGRPSYRILDRGFLDKLFKR